MSQIPFKQVDVFTSVPFKGNPVAVVLDATSLTSEQMKAIARWTNLSETTFVLPPATAGADYKVRIFTPGGELPFAGHPTIGTSFALLEAGKITPTNGKLYQECGAGLVELTVVELAEADNQNAAGELSVERIEFVLPDEQFTQLTEPQQTELESILGCSFKPNQRPCVIDVGPKWIVAQVDAAQTILDVTPDFTALKQFEIHNGVTGVCLYAFLADDQDTHIEVRTFAPSCGVNEDPVCGSGNGAVAAYLRALNPGENWQVRSFQGQKVGRNGQISLTISDAQIRVGGAAVTCIDGVITV